MEIPANFASLLWKIIEDEVAEQKKKIIAELEKDRSKVMDNCLQKICDENEIQKLNAALVNATMYLQVSKDCNRNNTMYQEIKKLLETVNNTIRDVLEKIGDIKDNMLKMIKNNKALSETITLLKTQNQKKMEEIFTSNKSQETTSNINQEAESGNQITEKDFLNHIRMYLNDTISAVNKTEVLIKDLKKEFEYEYAQIDQTNVTGE